MADRDEFRRPSEQDGGEQDGGELRRVPPGRRSLTQTIGGAPGAGATASPGKISLAHRIQSSAPMALPYRGEMEAGFGQDFSRVEVSRTTRDALGGAGGVAQGESVAFAGAPSRDTVAHELAHVVQHRQGLTGGQALFEGGSSPLDVAADALARMSQTYYRSRAKLPRPLVIEVLGDRFAITHEVDDKNNLVCLVRYDGPYQTGGENVKEGVLRMPAPRLELWTPLDVAVLEVRPNGILYDLTGTSVEIAELSFETRPHPADPEARQHKLKSRTGNKEGWVHTFDILLPNADRPAPEGTDPKDVEREKSVTLPVSLGPDGFQLSARRLGESASVALHFKGTGALGDSQYGNAGLIIPVTRQAGAVQLAALEEAAGSIKLDLDGDGAMDVRLVHTAQARGANKDGTQTHTHYIDAYDQNKVKVAETWFQVRGQPWEVPAGIDRDKSPPPDSAMVLDGQAPAQGNRPTEGSQPIRIPGGDWELRIDGDGDRQKELLLRFHQTDWGKPVTIAAIQVSTGRSSAFATAAWENNEPSQLEPELTQAADGVNQAWIRLFPSRSAGLKIYLYVDPPVDDGAERAYKFTVRSPSEDDQTHTARFPREEQVANPLLEDAKNNKKVAGIESMQARLGELGDPFLFAIEKSPGGMTLGIAGLNPDGSVGATSGQRLTAIKAKTFKVLEVTPTQVKLDVTGDDTADIIIRDAISQPLGRDASRQLLVERQHMLSISGPAVVGEGRPIFQLRGRSFVQSSVPGEAGKEGAGAVGAVVGITDQQQEGADIGQILGRFQAGVSRQILQAGERGFISPAMVSSWKGLSEEMIQLDAFGKVPAADKAKIQKREGEVRGAAVAHANTLYAELAAATTNERKSTPSKIEGESDDWSNPYTGAALQEHKGKHLGDGAYEASTFTEISPGSSARLGQLLSRGEDATAARLWGELQNGVERWAQTRLERELGKNDPTVKQGQYMTAMTQKLTAIKGNKNVQRVYATFTADEMHKGEKDYVAVTPLQLWAWQDDDGDWTLRDLTNPQKPFDCHAAPEYRRVDKAGDRPRHFPPHHLFTPLDDKKQFPKGVIRYDIPGSGHSGIVTCEARKKWTEWVQEIGLALAAIGLGLVTMGTGTVAVIGSYVLAASALAGAVAAAGELADAYEHGWLDGMTVMVNLLQIAGGVASAGSIVAGNLLRGARAATAAVEAGKKGAALWSGRLAKLAAMADKAYVPLTATALGTDIATVVVMGADLMKKLGEIDASGLSGDQATEAKMKLLAMFALTGGLTVLSIKGDLPAIKSHGSKGPTIVLDQVNGVPVAYAGGVRAGNAEINVSPRLGPDGKPVVDANLHATARWQTRDASVKGLSEDEMTWYRAWMEQPEKVKFKTNGEPEIIMPRLEGTPPAGLEAKLKGMVKSSDVALYDKAWARSAELDELRQANGGHLDIDPTSPIWPAERIKLKDKLTASLGSKRKAEEMLSRYELARAGGSGGSVLHANQAAKLSQVIPQGEIDGLRKMFPECEVYVSGSPITQGVLGKVDSIDVVVVVPKGTSPDLMGAIEMRASGVTLRPDPDYAKAHAAQGMNENSTLKVNARAVSSDQFFGLATARVKGKAPIEFHRLDVPTDPTGRAYTQAELESMNKAGYEFDPATGSFRLRPDASRAALAGTGTAALRGDNTILGNALPSEAVGEEVLRKLATGDAEVFRVVGIEPPKGFDPRVKEWGLGQREDGSWVLVEGEAGAVNWGKLPGVRARGHVHPIEVNGKTRHIEGTGGRKYITIDDLRSGKAPANDVMTLCPSGSDLARAHLDGRHQVSVPYVHLGGGMIGNPTKGGLDVPLEFDILHATQIGVSDIGQTIWYKAYVKIKAGDQVLYEGPMWGSQVDLGTTKFSDVTFKEPSYRLKEVPEGTPRGAWKVGGGATPSATGTNADEIAKARIQTVEERRKVLGADPKRGHIEHEALVGAEIEAAHGWFKRDLTGDGEWVSLTSGKSYDLVGFPAKAIPHVKVNEFTNSIKHHFLKSIDYIVVDIRGLSATKQTDIKAYIAANHATEGVYPGGRLLLLE